MDSKYNEIQTTKYKHQIHANHNVMLKLGKIIVRLSNTV